VVAREARSCSRLHLATGSVAVDRNESALLGVRTVRGFFFHGPRRIVRRRIRDDRVVALAPDRMTLVGPQGLTDGRSSCLLLRFSLSPLMVIAVAIAGLVFGDDAARDEVSGQLKDLFGDGAQAVEAMPAGVGRRHNGLFAQPSGFSRCCAPRSGRCRAQRSPSVGIWLLAKAIWRRW
jgi:hypothetical protein